MGRLVALASVAVLALALVVSAQDAVPDGQATFRAGVDVVDVEVSVLDRNRQPVRGLTAADFTVLEDGRPRPIVAFAPVELPARELPTASWMSDVMTDVQTNEFHREGRLIVLLLDRSITFAQSGVAREIAAAAVQQLRPGDLAAVTYSLYGVPQNFTADRRRLMHAIEQPFAGLPDGQGWSPAACPCGVCSLDTIRRVAEAVEHVRQRRKILLYIGSSISIQSSGACGGDQMVARQRALQAAEVSNLTIHTFDPAGVEAPDGSAADRLPSLRGSSLRRRGHLQFFPDHTGGRAIFNNMPAGDLPDVFRESSAYYLLGFQPAHADGRRHRITVRTTRPDVTLQARKAYVAAGGTPPRVAGRPPDVPPRLFDAVAGLWPATTLPLSLSAVPVAMPGLRTAALAVTVSVRQEADAPAVRAAAVGGATAVRMLLGAFDANGRAIRLRQQQLDVPARPAEGGQSSYEVHGALELSPGRYEIRAAIEDAALDVVGSVYTYVDVPDFRREPVSMSGVLLEAAASGVSVPADPFRSVLPGVPTARRVFAPTEAARAVVVIYQGVTRVATPGYVTAEIRDSDDRRVFHQESRIVPSDMGANRAVEFAFDLPVSRLAVGDYLLTIGVRSGNATARRDVRFAVR